MCYMSMQPLWLISIPTAYRYQRILWDFFRCYFNSGDDGSNHFWPVLPVLWLWLGVVPNFTIGHGSAHALNMVCGVRGGLDRCEYNEKMVLWNSLMSSVSGSARSWRSLRIALIPCRRRSVFLSPCSSLWSSCSEIAHSFMLAYKCELS